VRGVRQGVNAATAAVDEPSRAVHGARALRADLAKVTLVVAGAAILDVRREVRAEGTRALAARVRARGRAGTRTAGALLTGGAERPCFGADAPSGCSAVRDACEGVDAVSTAVYQTCGAR